MTNLASKSETLSKLRQSLAVSGGQVGSSKPALLTLGAPFLDEPLGGGIVRAALHEVYASCVADLAVATGFAAALAIRATNGRPLLWVRQDYLDSETGRLHPPGLAELGLDPNTVLLVRARDAMGVLRVAIEAARCPSIGVAVIEPWGEPRLFDFTASQRLSVAAATSGVMTILLRVSAVPVPSAAQTRWQVRARASRALGANSPGDPAFGLTLQRHRGGLGEREWYVEWNRDRRSFQNRALPSAAPISRPMVSFSADRSDHQKEGDANIIQADWRKTG